MDEKLLQDLEDRITTLEEKVLPTDGDNEKVMKVLLSANEAVTTFAAKRERFNQIFKRVPAISEYLSPGFIEAVSMDSACETEMVLASEDNIRVMAKQLEEIEKLSKALDSDKLKDLSGFQGKLAKLQEIQQQQLGDVSTLSQDLTTLLSTYNELVNYLSESFVKWDWTLTQLEEKQNEDG
uniref:Uncharacterized protein LOC100177191 n=1 Tax=Phallusia mammillata TaxID=59560 RepID=A0A6F9DHC9_9ASCI|nr:uncharacterized protein LOC100177191 [Phallusia mammillata]